jgi:TonB-dependent starch-binding outer membrane protein SusC
MHVKTLKKWRYQLVVIALLLISSIAALSAQTKSVYGTVRDGSGEPLVGVDVSVTGTQKNSITDANGKYTLNASAGDKLTFAFLGYIRQTITVGNQSKIDVVLMEKSVDLNEVVAIGYGTTKKTDLTGSVGNVSSDVLVAKGMTNVMGALQGTIPGVDISSTSARPGGSYSIQIRGQNSITSGSPLYVVDGVVTEDIDFINPSDIVKIDILKDASSTAIYGSRGSNGVILVQTKSAASIGKKSKAVVSYDGYYGIRQIAHTPEFMTGREWIDFRTSAFYSWNTTTESYQLTTSNQSAVLQGSVVVQNRLYNEDDEDWIDLATQNGQQQNHYINISGATNDFSYNIGLGYQKEDGNFIKETFDRYNMKVSVNHRPSKYFMSGATANLSQSTMDKGSEYGYRDIMKMPGILHAYDDDGEIIAQPGIKTVIQGSGNFTSSANPLLEIQSGTQETRRYDVISSFFAQIDPMEGLTLKTTLSPRFNRTREGKYYGVVLNNRSVDYASSSNKDYFDYTWDNQITYDRSFGEHHINATVINSVYKTRYEQLTVAAQDFPYKSLWYNIYSGTLISEDCSSSYAETALLSYAGRINYEYLGKYLATATIRYDGCSKLADKWAAFPSFALAWRASEEEFLKNYDWLSNLKARFSFGYSGNNNGVSAYGTQMTPITSSNVYYDYNGTMVSGFAPGTPVNQDLTWEKTRELDFGIDFGFFNRRISGTIDLYDKLSDGLLMSRRLAIESGVTSMTDNIGSVSNKGIELSLTTVNLSNKNFSWTTSFAFAHNKNAIESLYGEKEDVVGESRFIGEPINVVYDYKIIGVWTQAEYSSGASTYYNSDNTVAYVAKPGEAKTQDTNKDGILTTDDKTILGSPDPKWTGSFTSNFRYKNWDFSFNIYTKQGVFVYDQFLATYGYNTQRGMAKVKFDYYVPADVPVCDWNNFTVDGTTGNATVTWINSGSGHENSKYPIYKNINGAYYGNNGNYQDASFVKVKNIILGYTFNSDLTKTLGISHLRVYANILNPFVFTKYVGWDPEYATTSLEDGNGPSNITCQVGMNVKF